MRHRFGIIANGLTALAAIGALVFVVLQRPQLQNVERGIHEVREQIVTLRLPPGVHAHVVTITRKGVMPGTPGHAHEPRAHVPGGRSAPAGRRRRTHTHAMKGLDPMPYTIRKRGNEWVILKHGKTVGKSRTKANAQKSVKARLAAEHGAKLGRKRK